MSKILLLREGQELGKLMVCPLRFRRVEKSRNPKVMLGCEEIATAEDGVRVLLSDGKGLITIEHNGFYNHIGLEDLVNYVLENSEEIVP